MIIEKKLLLGPRITTRAFGDSIILTLQDGPETSPVVVRPHRRRRELLTRSQLVVRFPIDIPDYGTRAFQKVR